MKFLKHYMSLVGTIKTIPMMTILAIISYFIPTLGVLLVLGHVFINWLIYKVFK